MAGSITNSRYVWTDEENKILLGLIHEKASQKYHDSNPKINLPSRTVPQRLLISIPVANFYFSAPYVAHTAVHRQNYDFFFRSSQLREAYFICSSLYFWQTFPKKDWLHTEMKTRLLTSPSCFADPEWQRRFGERDPLSRRLLAGLPAACTTPHLLGPNYRPTAEYGP